MRNKIKLDARIDLGIDIGLPDESTVSLSIITPDGMLSKEASFEISDDLVDIQFSTALGKIGLAMPVKDLERLSQEVVLCYVS